MALAASYKRKLPVVAPSALRWGSPGNAPIFAGKENRAKPLYPQEEEEEEVVVFTRENKEAVFYSWCENK